MQQADKLIAIGEIQVQDHQVNFPGLDDLQRLVGGIRRLQLPVFRAQQTEGFARRRKVGAVVIQK